MRALRPRQWCPQTVVYAAAERMMVRPLARYVELVWLRIDRRVAVSRSEDRRDRLPGADFRPCDRPVLQWRPARHQHRALKAQHLLDGVLDQRGIVLQLLKLAPVAKQRPDAVSDEVRRRQVARCQQKATHRYDFVVRQLVSTLLRSDEDQK